MVQRVADQIARSTKIMAGASLRPWYIIDPRTSRWMGAWDGLTSIALMFTAIVTPVEVGFMQIPMNRWTDGLFLANRAVDAIFLSDMVLHFFLMYPPSQENEMGGGKWIDSLPMITRHYTTSFWFYLDAFSILVSGFDIFSPDNSAASRFKVFRAVRVLRLLKLVRLARGSRIFKRWEMRVSLNYAMLSIAQIVVMLIFVCHLFACIWGLQVKFALPCTLAPAIPAL